jgi:phosphoenolpyruvate carboxykinase (ATP)
LRIIAVPEWPERRVYVDPVERVTYILGTDYYGESKMSLLRLAMHLQREERTGLGLHAGSKVYRVLVDGKLVEKGALIFGLSGTGKTTITVSDHGLTPPEGVEILQDDINLWDESTFGAGTERNFYVKTDNVTSQPELLRACVAEDAIVENVPVKDGDLDFDDVDFCPNGRAVINRRRIPNTGEGIDLKRTDVIFFNTRRYDIPIAGKFVSPEQAATFFMLGESTKTSAGTMDRSEIGKPVRVVGFDPFIVDRPWKNGMRFREILKRNPRVEVYILNTGYVGGPDGVKIRPEDTFAMIKAILRGEVEWKYDGNVGYMVPSRAEGVELDRFDPYNVYDAVHYSRMMESLRRERMEYLKRFPEIDFFELQ